eukprot:6447094-Prymnesium_polylepis.2
MCDECAQKGAVEASESANACSTRSQSSSRKKGPLKWRPTPRPNALAPHTSLEADVKYTKPPYLRKESRGSVLAA